MHKRIAVITDATSADFWFPKWHKYYSEEFGAEALHVVTYLGHRADFKGFDLAALWDVPRAYDDKLRARLISSHVSTLLKTHDVVVRCDVDEFLIPDLRRYSGLRNYIDSCSMPYVSAYGIDVFERSGDAPIEMSLPILITQRRYGIANTPLHKIAITTVPLEWAPGFHAATAPPAFDSLFMFHMKFADIKRRSAWFDLMKASVLEGGDEYKYFSWTQEQMQGHKASLSNRPLSSEHWANLPSLEEQSLFLASVTKWPSGCYQGDFRVAKSAFIIPDEFRNRV